MAACWIFLVRFKLVALMIKGSLGRGKVMVMCAGHGQAAQCSGCTDVQPIDIGSETQFA